MTPSTKQPTFRKYVLRGLFLLCIILISGVLGLVWPAQAAIVCQQMTEVAQESVPVRAMALSEDQLVWVTKKTVQRYDITAQTIHTVAQHSPADSPDIVEVDGDHIVWMNAKHQIFLHAVSTDTTLKVSKGKPLSQRPILKSGYILYARNKTSDVYPPSFRLELYEIASGLTRHLTTNALSQWDMDNGRVVYTDEKQVFLYEIATGFTEVIATHDWVGSPQIDGANVVYIARVPLPPPDESWSASQVFVYNLETETHTQVTHVGTRTYIHLAWIDGDTTAWAQRSGLSGDSDVYVYDLLTKTVNGSFDNPRTSYDEIAPLEIDGRFITVYGFYKEPTSYNRRSAPRIYDRVSQAVLRLLPDGYNAGDTTSFRLAAGRLALTAYVVSKPEQGQVVEISKRAVYLIADCGATPNIHAQSESGKVLSGRPKALFVEAKGDLPLSYQWYQGEAGDTSVPVGENSPTYTTPDLMTTVSYWVWVTNPLGSTKTETITLSPAPSYQLVLNKGFEKPLNQPGGFWDDFWINRDFPKTKRICNTPERLVAYEGKCAYRFSKPRDKDVYTDFHYISQELDLPQVEAGDVLTVSAFVNSINVFYTPYITLEVWYTNQPDSVLTLEGDPNAEGYTLMTGTLTLTSGDIWFVDLYIGYPGKKGRVFFDAVTVTASVGESASVLLPLPDAPGDLRESNR